jgi:aromatic ring-opening dioxygenase catalytic subunit (LigB family)
LILHNLGDRSIWSETTSSRGIKDFVESVISAAEVQEVRVNATRLQGIHDLLQAGKRQKALFDLVKHPAFRTAHPREEHFVPIYVAAGAGEEGETKLINTIFAGPTIAFGV